MPSTRSVTDLVRKGTGGRPTLEASAALADSILDTAWRLFVENGYKHLSVDAIARDAAVGKRTVYDRFGSKEGLFEAMVHRASRRWTRQAGAVFELNSHGDWLKPLIGHLFDLFRAEDFLALSSFLTTEGRAFPRLVSQQAQQTDQSWQAFAEHFAPRIENYPEGEDGRLLARSVLALIMGWARLFAQSDPPLSAEVIRARVSAEARALLAFHGCGGLIANQEGA